MLFKDGGSGGGCKRISKSLVLNPGLQGIETNLVEKSQNDLIYEKKAFPFPVSPA